MEFIQRSDTSAFDELYHRYSQRLLLYFYRELGGDEEKAQDFLQELFLKVVEKPNLFCTERKFATWIFTVACNMCKNEYRRLEIRNVVNHNVDVNEIQSNSDGDYHPAERNMDRKAFEKALMAELEKLENGHRSAFLLRFQQNLTLREIGDVLGCSEGTVKSRLFYTTHKLASRLRAFNPYRAEVPKDERIK